jgi:hypothetical protein
VTPNRRSIHRHSIPTRFALLFVLFSVLGGLVGACAAPQATATPTTVPTPVLDASGQPIVKPVGAAATPSEFAGWGVTISKVGRAKTITKAGLIALEAKGVWLILHLIVSNGGKAAGSFPRQSLAVKDATGKEYKLDATTSDHYSIGAKLPSQSGVIALKGTLEVGAVFDIDPAAAGLKLKVGTQEIAIKE